MNIGLIDVDGHHFPNFALMKISAWHKAHGDSVEWAVPDLFGDEYHRVYASKIFTFTPDFVGRYGCEVIKAAPGTTFIASSSRKSTAQRRWIIPSIRNIRSRSSSFLADVSAGVRSASSTTRRVSYTRWRRCSSTQTANG